MAKKKKGKVAGKKKKGKGSKKGSKGDAKPVGPSETELLLLQRLHDGYVSRLAGDPPLAGMLEAMKLCLKGGSEPLKFLVLDAVDMDLKKAATESNNENISTAPDAKQLANSKALEARSCLAPLLKAVRETGYTLLFRIALWRLPTLRACDVAAISEHLIEWKELSALEIVSCPLSAATLSLLGRAIGFNKGLKKLRIGHCSLDLSEFSQFCRDLSHNGTIVELTLDHCGIQGQHGQWLTEPLSRMVLHTAVLDGNKLGCHGLALLSPCLAASKTLETLSLQNNNIDPANGDIVSAMRSCCDVLVTAENKLTKLDLGFNSVGPDAGGILLEMHAKRKEGSLKGIKVPVGPRGMTEEMFSALNKAGSTAKKGAKKKGVKKKGAKKGAKKKKKKK